MYQYNRLDGEFPANDASTRIIIIGYNNYYY